MYAIVEIAGVQFKAEKGRKLYIPLMQKEAGETVEFDKVLLTENDGNVKVGTPTVAGAKVTAKVIADVKGDKVKVFKKKRRKGYRVLNGHRQKFTQVLVEGIDF